MGLPETRSREWLLDIAFGSREIFAYSCEAYARILERARNPADRRALADEYANGHRIADERVDPAEIASVVCEAAGARNGWKVVLARCAPTPRSRGPKASDER